VEIWSLETVLRNGHALTVSSLLTSVIGALYRALAAHAYSDDSGGRTYSAVAAMMLWAGVGHLNMANVVIRFTRVPVTAARPGRRGLSGRVCGDRCPRCGIRAADPGPAPGLMFPRRPLVACGFVLTGLRRPGWVVLENLVFALVNIVLMVMLAFLAATGTCGPGSSRSSSPSC
jgi:hypothetical protein